MRTVYDRRQWEFLSPPSFDIFFPYLIEIKSVDIMLLSRFFLFHIVRFKWQNMRPSLLSLLSFVRFFTWIVLAYRKSIRFLLQLGCKEKKHARARQALVYFIIIYWQQTNTHMSLVCLEPLSNYWNNNHCADVFFLLLFFCSPEKFR